MRSWAKYIFLSFFKNNYANESNERSGFNVFLFLAVVFVCFIFAPTIGYIVSFNRHYANSSSLQGALREITEKNSLYVENGKLCTEDVAAGDKKYYSDLAGYEVVIDTRDSATTFDDIDIYCEDNDGNKISYDVYRGFSDENKAKYSIKANRTGRAVEYTAENVARYEAFLDGNEKFALLQAKKETITEYQYFTELYVMYFRAYYPEWLYNKESFGEAPTVKSYYLAHVRELMVNKKNYILFFDNVASIRFVSDGGVERVFSGDYKDFAGSIDSIERVDAFVKSVFGSSAFHDGFFNTLINMRMLLVAFVAWLLLAWAVFLADKWLHKRDGDFLGYMGSVKLVSAFFMYPALLAFVAAIISSLFVSYANSLTWMFSVFGTIVLGRVVAYLVIESRRAKKRSPANNEVLSDEILGDGGEVLIDDGLPDDRM